MLKNTSYIDMLDIDDSKLQPQQNNKQHIKQMSSLLTSLPRYESQDLFSQPMSHKNQEQTKILVTPPRSHAYSLYVTTPKINQQQNIQNGNHEKLGNKIDQNVTNNSNNNKKVENSSKFNVRNDELVFQLKLKLVSFMKKFNVESGALSDVRDQSIQTILQFVFKRFKEYSKQHQNLQKHHTECMKIKQIQILKLQTQILTLEESIYEQTNRWNRIKEKHKQECSNLHHNILAKNTETQELQQRLYMAESIIKQQNQYIKQIETNMQQKDKQNLLEQQLVFLKIDIQTTNQKNAKLVKQLQQISQQVRTLKQQNGKLNQQINNIMQQNKQYKYETMLSKQRYEKSQIELQQSQQKLITYFGMYQKQRQAIQDMNQKYKQLDGKYKDSIKIIQDLQKKLCQLIMQKESSVVLTNNLRKEKDAWMNEVKAKESDIIKLNKNLQEVISTYKNRPALKRTKTQSQEQQSDNYTIIISPTKSQKSQTKKNQVTEQYHQQQIKIMAEQWKSKMLSTVDYYQKIVEDLQKQLGVKQGQIKHLQFAKTGIQSSNVSTALQY